MPVRRIKEGKESWINPIDGIITSSFGERINPVLKKKELHTGLDIGAAVGTPVLAVAEGKVTEAGTSGTYGHFVKYSADNYVIMYAHLSKIMVKEGEGIKKGQIIAQSGNSGLSTGAHLHYSIWKDGKLIDPMSFVTLPYTEEVKEEYTARAGS